jgi:hypothetical protein
VEDDVEMLTLPAARPEFINLSEAEVWKAVDDEFAPLIWPTLIV